MVKNYQLYVFLKKHKILNVTKSTFLKEKKNYLQYFLEEKRTIHFRKNKIANYIFE